MTDENDSKKVPRFPLMPIRGRVQRHERRKVTIGVGNGYFNSNPAIMSDGQQTVNNVQLTIFVLWK